MAMATNGGMGKIAISAAGKFETLYGKPRRKERRATFLIIESSWELNRKALE